MASCLWLGLCGIARRLGPCLAGLGGCPVVWHLSRRRCFCLGYIRALPVTSAAGSPPWQTCCASGARASAIAHLPTRRRSPLFLCIGVVVIALLGVGDC